MKLNVQLESYSIRDVQAELDVACTAVGLAERALLYVLGFELNVMHPFKPLQAIMEAQRLVRNEPFHPPTGMSMVPQLAWDFMNCRRGSCPIPRSALPAAVPVPATGFSVRMPGKGCTYIWQGYNAHMSILCLQR